ncbi:unnamed protein product [Adineta steineri]|uniref:Secreted protein n=1 Tax=Adineta steineri TaxID=433720 RepID=A0A815AK02_9BILA|nr:unnamed protein product [Adineta steineri]CAF3785477.1 unnamed protein product [Adineta steineri]
MKLILVVLTIAQIYGAFGTSASLQEQRGLMEIWDVLSPWVSPVALHLDNAIGGTMQTINNIQTTLGNAHANTVTTLTNAHAAVSGAVTNAIGGITSWIGAALPALGKRDLEIDARLSLLSELKSFRVIFQQSILEFIQTALNGNIVTQVRQLLTKITTLLKAHLNIINTMITNLIPTMHGTVATQAITSCLHAVQVIEEAMKNIQALFSS